MAKPTVLVKPKKRGRPATGVDPFVGLRFPAERIAEIDAWAKRRKLTRSEAIRQMVELALSKR
jgi:hypothetical protein